VYIIDAGTDRQQADMLHRSSLTRQGSTHNGADFNGQTLDGSASKDATDAGGNPIYM